MKHLLIGALAGALLCIPALAQQQRGGNAGGAANNTFGAQGGATFQLPPSVQNVVSIDALNLIVIASEGERAGQTQYSPILIKHVYSGGIARLFGGFSVPTAQFATPGSMDNGGFGNQNGGVATAGGNNNNGAQNGFGGGFQNNGGGGFGGGQNGFGGGFQNGVLGGNGFNTNERNAIVNAQVRAR